MTSIGKENRSSQYLSYNREGERQRQKDGENLKSKTLQGL